MPGALYKTWGVGGGGRRYRVGVQCVVISSAALLCVLPPALDAYVSVASAFCVLSLWAPWPPRTGRCRRSSTLRLAGTTTSSTTTTASSYRTLTDGESKIFICIYVRSWNISCYLSVLFLHGIFAFVWFFVSVKFASMYRDITKLNTSFFLFFKPNLVNLFCSLVWTLCSLTHCSAPWSINRTSSLGWSRWIRRR
jgi:hypothetical protein